MASYDSDQEAEQNAALHAILLVEGALNRGSPQAVVTYVGFDPLRSGGLMTLAEAQQLVEGRHLRVQQQMVTPLFQCAWSGQLLSTAWTFCLLHSSGRKDNIGWCST